MHSILITTECVADLPKSMLGESNFKIIYFDIETNRGVFRDTVEIDSQNVLEYMMGGKNKVLSVVPTANDYKNFFFKHLHEYDEIIHICISSGISIAYENAMLARAKMGRDGEKVHIVDSLHLSSGQGLVAMEALNCINKGMTSRETLNRIEEYIPRVSTSFLAFNADYLYFNKKVDKFTMKMCNCFKLHPVLKMIDGKLTVHKVYIGNYNNCASKYIRDTIGETSKVDTAYGFLTYVGCSAQMIEDIESQIEKIVHFDTLHEGKASATVSCNCGPKTFGILYVSK